MFGRRCLFDEICEKVGVIWVPKVGSLCFFVFRISTMYVCFFLPLQIRAETWYIFCMLNFKWWKKGMCWSWESSLPNSYLIPASKTPSKSNILRVWAVMARPHGHRWKGMRVPTTRIIVRATPMIAWQLTRVLVVHGGSRSRRSEGIGGRKTWKHAFWANKEAAKQLNNPEIQGRKCEILGYLIFGEMFDSLMRGFEIVRSFLWDRWLLQNGCCSFPG